MVSSFLFSMEGIITSFNFLFDHCEIKFFSAATAWAKPPKSILPSFASFFFVLFDCDRTLKEKQRLTKVTKTKTNVWRTLENKKNKRLVTQRSRPRQKNMNVGRVFFVFHSDGDLEKEQNVQRLPFSVWFFFCLLQQRRQFFAPPTSTCLTTRQINHWGRILS